MPNTTRGTRARTIAPAHIAHGSSVTYRTESSTRQLPERAGGLAQRDHLGVGGGVGADLALVVAGADHLAVPDDHRADRDVVVLERPRRPRAAPGA